METKQEVKIGYPYDRFIFRINGRLQSLQWHSKSETICLGMPEHSIYLFLVSYLRKWLLLKHWATSWGIHLIHCTMKPYSKISWIVHKTHTHTNAWIYDCLHLHINDACLLWSHEKSSICMRWHNYDPNPSYSIKICHHLPKYGSLLKREFSLSLCRSEAELIPASLIIKGALFAWFLYITLIIIWIKALLFMLQSTNAKCHHLLTVKLFCWVQKIFWKTFIQQDALHWSKVTLKTFTLFQKIIY